MYLNIKYTLTANPNPCLTLTWDVFKWKWSRGSNNTSKSLTLTWDVFK